MRGWLKRKRKKLEIKPNFGMGFFFRNGGSMSLIFYNFMQKEIFVFSDIIKIVDKPHEIQIQIVAFKFLKIDFNFFMY